MQQLLYPTPLDAADRTEPSGPKDLAEHGSVLQQLLLVRRKPVQACRDDSLDGLRERQLVGSLGKHAYVLLRIERIAFGALEQCGLQFRR